MMDKRPGSSKVVQAYQMQEVACKRIPQSLLINMFGLRSCVLNAADGRSFSVQFRSLHRENEDRINFEGIFVDGDLRGYTFTGFFDANDCRPTIRF